MDRGELKDASPGTTPDDLLTGTHSRCRTNLRLTLYSNGPAVRSLVCQGKVPLFYCFAWVWLMVWRQLREEDSIRR